MMIRNNMRTLKGNCLSRCANLRNKYHSIFFITSVVSKEKFFCLIKKINNLILYFTNFVQKIVKISFLNCLSHQHFVIFVSSSHHHA